MEESSPFEVTTAKKKKRKNERRSRRRENENNICMEGWSSGMRVFFHLHLLLLYIYSGYKYTQTYEQAPNISKYYIENEISEQELERTDTYGRECAHFHICYRRNRRLGMFAQWQNKMSENKGKVGGRRLAKKQQQQQ